MYKAKVPFNVPMKILIPTWKIINGVRKKEYPKDGDIIFGSFRTFGGTETTVNGVYTIKNTAVVETWFRPDIKSDCAVMLADSGEIYEIIGEPEDIEMRHQYLKFKIERTAGKP